ncbi:MAG: dihydroorotase [Syntrophomonadaceae bacterium]|nr:dihydroorotase [Syntrophomonadaceae bacterium]
MRWLVKGGRVVDPASGIDQAADILIEEGKIAALIPVLKDGSKDHSEPMTEEINPENTVAILKAKGKLVVPGLIDMHVHLREPGFERKETIATGTRAAARGGFTSVACMPNTKPVADNRSVLEFIQRQAQLTAKVHVYPIAAITKGSRGEELSEMGDLIAGGAVAFSDDGRPVMNTRVMRLALEYARIGDWPIISHCEDLNLAAEGQMNEGYWSMLLGLQGIPNTAEETMVARDIMLAEMTGARLHIAHVSTAGSVQLIREAKSRGVRVSAEVTPHHLVLTDEAVVGYSTFTKVNPPLRAEKDRQALLEGLVDGTIEVIATDHAPHTLEEKDCEYGYAPFGISGLETALPLVWSELVEKKVLSLEKLITCMTVNPARILGLNRGSLMVGAAADITVIDPDLEQVVKVADFVSRGKNSPFEGKKLKGWPVATMVAGQLVMQDGQII